MPGDYAPGTKKEITPTQDQERIFPPPPEGYMEDLKELYGKENVEKWNLQAEDFLRANKEEIVMDKDGGNEAYKKLVKAMEAGSGGGHSGGSFPSARSMIMYKAVNDLDYRMRREKRNGEDVVILIPGF